MPSLFCSFCPFFPNVFHMPMQCFRVSISLSCISSRKPYLPLKVLASNQPNRLTVRGSRAIYLIAPIITPIPNELRSGLPLAK